MNSIKNISLGIFHGMFDSICGMTIIFTIDRDIHQLNMEEQRQKLQNMKEYKRQKQQRAPSPTPSSASAMARRQNYQNKIEQNRYQRNSDERSLQSLLYKPPPPPPPPSSPSTMGNDADEIRLQEMSKPPEKKIAKHILKVCILNGGFTWLSIILFHQLLLPSLQFLLMILYGTYKEEFNIVWQWVQSVLTCLFDIMWVMPIFIISKFVSAIWFSDIGNAAYRSRKGLPQIKIKMSKAFADFLFSLLVQALFLAQGYLVSYIPSYYIGNILYFIHFTLLYSLYSFEYKWVQQGWELHRRLNYIENNWPYFLGFGLPLTLLCNSSSSMVISSCIFSILFPLFILSANEAKPVIQTTNIPLRVFSPVIFVSNLFFKHSEPAPNAAANVYNSGRMTMMPSTPIPTPITRPTNAHHLQHLRQNTENFMIGNQSTQSSYRYKQPPPLIAGSRRSSTSDRTRYVMETLKPATPSTR